MILAIDIGNTNIVVGCIDEEKIYFTERLSTVRTKTELEYAVDLKTVLDIYHIKRTDIEGCIISSVVPQITGIAKLAAEKILKKEVMVLGPGVKTGLNIVMDNPGQLGADLVADAVAGLASYPVPLVVIDMGTATTISVVNRKKQYIGGMIMPGVGISLDALTARASQLSGISIDAPRHIIGKNTIECMKSGVLYSNAAALEQQHIFTNKMLRTLLIPVIFEQVLNSLMGTVDTMMVSNVGSAAISAVSLVDSINVLVIQAFSALAAGGAILCSQYIGQKNHEMANKSARQVLFIITAISVAVTALCLLFRVSLLKLIFGKVESDVMTASQVYFFYTALSFPFIALYDAGASIFRSQGNTRGPMIVSVISNVINIGGNAALIWGFNMGVAGAAIATLASRVFCAVVVLWQLRMDRQPIVVRNYRQIRPDGKMIRRVLALGIPSGIENSMFQLGKLAIQSSVSTLGTVAIAAQAMTNILENLNGIAAIGVGIGLMTVVGQCLGAGRKDEAVYYIKKLSVLAEIIVVASCLLVFALTIPVTKLGGMEPESARMCFHMISWITVVKPIVWTLAFIPAYGLRAAGDVKFSMITSCITMWTFRFCLCVYLIRFRGFGPMAVWIGMFTDWTVRGIVFSLRFHSRKWLKHKVV